MFKYTDKPYFKCIDLLSIEISSNDNNDNENDE